MFAPLHDIKSYHSERWEDLVLKQDTTSSEPLTVHGANLAAANVCNKLDIDAEMSVYSSAQKPELY